MLVRADRRLDLETDCECIAPSTEVLTVSRDAHDLSRHRRHAVAGYALAMKLLTPALSVLLLALSATAAPMPPGFQPLYGRWSRHADRVELVASLEGGSHMRSAWVTPSSP